MPRKYADYQNKFYKKNYRNFTIKLNTSKDQEMIQYLESKENVTSYIKELVEKEMQENR